MARSAAAATSGLSLSQWLRPAPTSLAKAMNRSAELNGKRSRVAINNARAVRTAATLTTQTIDVRRRFQARTYAEITNMPRTPAVAEFGNTANRSVSSQSMGARISVAVLAYTVLAKRASAGTRAAH